jgi:hypothetical protein
VEAKIDAHGTGQEWQHAELCSKIGRFNLAI